MDARRCDEPSWRAALIILQLRCCNPSLWASAWSIWRQLYCTLLSLFSSLRQLGCIVNSGSGCVADSGLGWVADLGWGCAADSEINWSLVYIVAGSYDKGKRDHAICGLNTVRNNWNVLSLSAFNCIMLPNTPIFYSFILLDIVIKNLNARARLQGDFDRGIGWRIWI